MDKKLLISALVMSAIWASASALVGHSLGYRSVAALLCAVIGGPGLFLAAAINGWAQPSQMTAATWIIAILGNWIFYFVLLWILLVLARKLREGREGAER
jgi:hypothetical protein